MEILPPIANSDHNSILITPIFNSASVETLYVTKRKQTHRNKVALVNALKLENWDFLYADERSCEEQFSIFNNKIQQLMDTHLPWTTIKRPANTKLWVTDQFLQTVSLRNEHWKKGNRLLYVYYRNKTEKCAKD